MTKKQYVIKLLTALENDRPLAKGLLTLIQQWEVDDETIGALSKIFIQAVNKVSQKINTKKLEKAWDILRKIQEIESHEKNGLEELDIIIDEL